MKRSIKFVVAIIVSVVTVICILFGCQKEKDKTTVELNQDKALAVMKRINDFKEIREAVNSGIKSNGVMTVEEMRQAIDATFNYEHSQHMTYCNRTTLDTFCISMPAVDINGNVNEVDVVNTYNAFETELDRIMLSVSDGMNVPSRFSIIMPETNAKENDEIKVVFTRGQEGNLSGQSLSDMLTLNSGLCLYWGYGLGCCDSILQQNCPFDDATDFLSQLFEYCVTPPAPYYVLILNNVEYVTYTAYNYPSNLNWVYWEPATPPTCSDYWLYVVFGEFEDDEPCICWDELLCYYQNVTQHVVMNNGNLHYSPRYQTPYFECSFDYHHLYRPLLPPDKRSVRIHSLTITYADPVWYNPISPD